MAKRTKDNGRKSRARTKAEHAAFTDEQIRLRAYDIYLARGATTGNELTDWLQAEKELLTEADHPRKTSKVS